MIRIFLRLNLYDRTICILNAVLQWVAFLKIISMLKDTEVFYVVVMLIVRLSRIHNI